MFLKICANTNLEDAALAAELGASAVGFVFAPSKRIVTVEQVAAITPHLPATVEKVGVFTTTDPGEIVDAAKRAGLTMVQLHSAFDPQLLEAITTRTEGKLTLLQVIDVAADTTPEELRLKLHAALTHPCVAAALLDASHGGASGGTGKTFDWDATAALVRKVQTQTGGQVLIAGGLNPHNVAEAIHTFAPWGVDVASGVESSPGAKDPVKLREFLVNARHAKQVRSAS
ncbi:phosphoribosylanthranilate isomerase [Bryocella elongata]|uniref:N-(5'-phosphoribosyl)anthranilate isomerase n=1 Tax=Bryocella elongata TaxID=863522 RepID=A0A1H6A899_9BACT|nr:phosphoribosylanthranilate isomerase [Bryocella elongata]SEG44969.1 phosphoribosylanthranilate isomerase [Bryocella elongata]